MFYFLINITLAKVEIFKGIWLTIYIISIIYILFSTIINLGFFKNTKFIIGNSSIVRHSDFYNELKNTVPIKQITNIDYQISWFWDKIFSTGNINIYTAGSTSEEANIFSIENVKEIYKKINSKFSFQRKKENLIKTIKPNSFIPALYSIAHTFILALLFSNLIIKYPYTLLIILIIGPIISFFTYLAYKKKNMTFLKINWNIMMDSSHLIRRLFHMKE